jgi:hypothetical protein
MTNVYDYRKYNVYIINERADDTYENELYYNKINPNGVSDYNDAPLFPAEKIIFSFIKIRLDILVLCFVW